MFERQRIRDPLHNLIEFGDDEFENALWDVLQTRAFQRLRRIKQLGFSDQVYPGATHSRFAHSVGVFHTAKRLMRVVRKHLTASSRFRETKAETALAAALVHDLGHGPFSHAFEDVGKRLKLKMANHETVGSMLIRDGEVAECLKVLGSGFANDVAAMITEERPSVYGAVVSSQFDADRLDYMQRDRLMTGNRLGGIDFEWLLANLEVGYVSTGVDQKELGKFETLVIGPKAISAVESYVLGLFQLYPSVYFHKTTRGAEKVLIELLCRLFKLVKDGSQRLTGLKANHPLVRFIREQESTEIVLSLDDTVIWGALGGMADARDEVIRELAVRLRDRKLFKAIDIRERVKLLLGVDRVEEVDRACASARLKIDEWCAARSKHEPRIIADEKERSPYKVFQQSKGPANQIMVKTTQGGELVDIRDRSEVLRELQPIRLFRAYLRDEDKEARDFVETIILGVTEHGTKH